MKIARISPLLALVAILLLLVSGPGVRLGWWTFLIGFHFLKWAAIVGLVAAALGMLFLLVPATRRNHSAWLVISILVGLGVAWLPWHSLQQAHEVPAIHDISTDTHDPPAFVAVLPLRKDAPNSASYGGAVVANQQRVAYPDIQSLQLSLPPAQVFDRARNAAKSMGWAIDAEVPGQGRIEATATTAWFGFKDDIVVRIRAHGAGSIVDVRSESRLGESDVGTNAARIRKYLEALSG